MAWDIVPLLPCYVGFLRGAAVGFKVKASSDLLNPITHLSYEAPLPEGNTSGSAEDSMQLNELMVLVHTLVTMINSLEKELKETKQTLGNVVLKLVKNVKSLEKALKRKSKKGVSKEKSTDKGKRYRRRARSMAKKIDTGLDAEEEINNGREEINTGIEEVSTGSTKVDFGIASKKGQREGKAPMVEEDIQATHKTKEQMRQEEDGLEEAIKLQAQLDEKIDTFVLINLEATKAKLKRYGEELQTKTSKKQRFDDKDVPVIGDKVTKSAQEDSETDKEESVEAMNPTPLTTKSNSVVNWKIFQQGQRSVYQIIRANGVDTVYMSFGAMIKDFTREDLIELYRLVMQKYGTNRPEDAYDRVLWSDLRTMFDPPLNEDAIWSLPLQQKMVSWRYYDKCEVHCLTLEACTIYMLADRKYPLSKEACQVMLKMKLLDGKMNEVCYKLLKMIEKQAGIRK
ncbi:hypothetical protein Tco_1457367 [Tanacetum coccineum]